MGQVRELLAVPGPYAVTACDDAEDSDAWMEDEASRIEARMSEQERGASLVFAAPPRRHRPRGGGGR